MTKNDEVQNLAEVLQEALLKAGIVVQRYDAYSTDSIYLKLDYGVCNSIRISNHNGKRYLKYRYNIGSHIPKYRMAHDRYDRYYYPACQVTALIRKIEEDRQQKIKRYGPQRYKHMMEENLKEHQNVPGFWKKARLVGKEKRYAKLI